MGQDNHGALCGCALAPATHRAAEGVYLWWEGCTGGAGDPGAERPHRQRASTSRRPLAPVTDRVPQAKCQDCSRLLGFKAVKSTCLVGFIF